MLSGTIVPIPRTPREVALTHAQHRAYALQLDHALLETRNVARGLIRQYGQGSDLADAAHEALSALAALTVAVGVPERQW